MNRYLIVVVIFFLSYSFSYSQNDNSNKGKSNFISWTKDRKLKVSDFKIIKKKLKENDYTGMTYTDIQYNYKITKDSIFVTIRCVFNTRLSWLNSTDTNQYGLKHEQGHFDIGEIMAREMRRDFYESYNPNKAFNVYATLKKFRLKYVKKLNKLNLQYDNETNHSVNKIKQLEWETIIIPNMLFKNESYDNAMILITTRD